MISTLPKPISILPNASLAQLIPSLFHLLSTYFGNSVRNNLDLMGFTNIIWFRLCRDCDLIQKVWLPLLGSSMGVHAGIAQRQQGDVTTVSFLLLDGCPGPGSDQMVFRLRKGTEDLMIRPPASREAESPSNHVL